MNEGACEAVTGQISGSELRTILTAREPAARPLPPHCDGAVPCLRAWAEDPMARTGRGPRPPPPLVTRPRRRAAAAGIASGTRSRRPS